MPANPLRGRMRPSTALLLAIFLTTLTTYVLVRPVPATVANSGSAAAPPTQSHHPLHRRSAAPTVTPRVTAPASGPTRTPTWRPSPGPSVDGPAQPPQPTASAPAGATG